MNKIKLLTFSVVLLLLLNLGILVFLFAKGGKEKNQEPREVVIDKLHFDKNQIADYNKLITVNKMTIRGLNDSIKINKNELYSQLKTVQNKTITDSLFIKIAHFQAEIESTHYNHFLDIKKLCKPNQLEDYNQLTTELSKIFSNKKEKERR